MALKDITGGRKEAHETISLGGKEFVLRFPNRAFRQLQEELGGWVKAWLKMGNRDANSPYPNEINFDVLAQMLVIGIYQEDVTISKVSTWLNDLMQDETADIINAMVRAKDRYAPEPKDKIREILAHLTEAQALLVQSKRGVDAESLTDLINALTQEVEDNQDDPQR